MLKGKFLIPESVNKDAQDLIRGMLMLDPKERYTIEQVLDHPFLAIPQYNENVSNRKISW